MWWRSGVAVAVEIQTRGGVGPGLGKSTPSAFAKVALFFWCKMVQDASRAPDPSRWMTWGWRTGAFHVSQALVAPD
ncbi:hypothetical protein MAPG_11657 [Magnaporthiopsis poae ATCC 64411]|uniref:Uncharacterized protein n=1 Tax=Magnaporthiopsis poae (strain ATCC 64411 / 73-15) TaxID=644358 RepID=A0A0C4EFU9_MAGP6|nr:hypothetical protein MAPG_11657 [Magnaporthiopsis poae ATCC 64411]